MAAAAEITSRGVGMVRGAGYTPARHSPTEAVLGQGQGVQPLWSSLERAPN